MKMIIQENQCGYLMKNGVFQQLITAGLHRFSKHLGYSVIVTDMTGEVDFKGIPSSVLLQNKEAAALIVPMQIPDDSIALHYVDGQFRDVLVGDEHFFWNKFHKHTFRLINISEPEVDPTIPRFVFAQLPASLYRKVEVENGEVALLYYDNQYQHRLTCGAYYFWNWKRKVTHSLFDLKVQQADINGQEILTADKVGVRMNLTFTYRITDPEGLASKLRNLESQLYVYAQLVVREYVGRFRLDELLEQKEDISQFVLEKLRERQEEYFVDFRSAGIKDVILPGEIRDIMNTVLVAEKTAQANVITRREEVASTRSLLNTARLMDENQTLYKLKELEYLEKICDRVGTISVGGGSVLEQLKQLVTN